jgi:hypothetical protein
MASIFKHGDDYPIWKLKALGILASKDLVGMDLELVDWIKINPGKVRESEKDEWETEWLAEQMRALYMLYTMLDGQVIKKLEGIKLAVEAFKKLDALYIKEGGIEVLTLMFKLFNLRMSGVEIEKYLATFDELVDGLERRGHKVVEVERAVVLLCGVPEDWSQLRSQIFLQHGFKNLNVDVVKNDLRQHAASLVFGKVRDKQEGSDEIRSGGEKAMMATIIKCNKCKRKGHVEANCATKCFKCGKIGHVAANCREKREKEAMC